MANINATKTILGAVLISTCAFSLFLAASSFQQLKTAEDKFNKEKAALIKEGMDLQDKVDSLIKELKEKVGALTIVETEKKATAQKISMLEKENKDIAKRFIRKMEELKNENELLLEKIESAKKTTASQLLKEILAGEENEKVKKLIGDTLNKIEMIRAGKSVDLEPIVVTGDVPADIKEKTASEEKTGKVLSVDPKNNLIVIDISYSDGIKENQRCNLSIDGKEMASAGIISARHRISAAFVDEITHGYSINDVKEGIKVSVAAE